MNIGFLGAGKVARLVAATLAQMPGVTLHAVAARSAARAQAFAKEFGFAKAYGSYKELVADSKLELVYINTTIAHHAGHIKLCLEAGKPVLCEKAFTTTAAEARDVLALARQEGIFVGEAVWPRYMPMVKTIRSLINSGALGHIQTLHANLGYPVSHIPRINDPTLSGGALLDIGVYPLTFASICFGNNIESLHSTALLSQTGVDQQSMTQLVYQDGRHAFLFISSLTPTARTGAVYGSKGYLVVENINNFRLINLYDDDNNLVRQIFAPPQISGYEYQFEAAIKSIRTGQIECDAMPHSTIIAMMEQMDAIRHSWGMHYPCETNRREEPV